MKISFKQGAAVLLTASLAGMALAGCAAGGAGSASKSPEGGAAAGQTGQSGQAASAPAGGKMPVIKLLVPNNVEEFPAGSDVNNNEIVKLIREKTGFDTQWELLPKDGEAARQKLNVLMASGDTPDIIIINDKATFGSFLQQGLLTPLDPLLDEVGQDVRKTLTPEQWKSSSFNGKIYAVRTLTFNTPTKSLLTRKDWLDAAGIQEPKTIDDFYNVLKAIKAKKPDVIPYGAALAQGGGDLSNLEAIAGAYGQAVDYSLKDGKVVYNPVEPDAKEFLTFANKLYSEGLLDKEALVNKADNLKEKLVSGKTAMTTVGWADAKTIDDALKTKEPSSKLVYIDPPAGKNGMQGVAKATSLTKYFVIPKFSKNAKAAMQFLNKASSQEVIDLISFGVEGKHYEKKDGQFIATKEAENIRYRVYYNLFDTVELGLQRMKQKGFEPYFNGTIKPSKYENVLDLVPPIELVDKKTKELTDLKKEYWLKIISGALPVSAFDEYVAKWKKAGGEDVLKALSDAYLGK